jgi:hypothetical protein
MSGSWSGSGTGGLQYLQFYVENGGRDVCRPNGRVAGCLSFFMDSCARIDPDGAFRLADAAGREVAGRFTSRTTAEGTWTAPGCNASGRWIADGPSSP